MQQLFSKYIYKYMLKFCYIRPFDFTRILAEPSISPAL